MALTLKNKCEALWGTVCDAWQSCDAFGKKYSLVFFYFFGVLYKFVLDIVYVLAVNPIYGYAGMVVLPVSWKYFISWAIYLITFFMLPKREKETIPFLLHLQFAYTVAPMLTFYAFANGSTKYVLMVFVCILLQIWLLRKPASPGKKIRITGIQNYVTILLGIVTVFTACVPILYNGFAGLKAFDVEYIYEMRANATYPMGFSYLFNWVQKTIIPFALICFIHKKKYGWCAVCVLFQIIFYIESGWKFTLFVLVPIIAIYLLFKTGHLVKLMYAGLSAALLVVLVSYWMDDHSGLSNLGVMLNAFIPVRALFIPAQVKFSYFEFFQVFPHTYFSDGMIGKLLGLTNPYAGAIGQVIYAYNGGPFMAANDNTGYLGDAYAQMGFAGMLLMSLLLAAILRVIQNYSNKENACVLTALFSVFMIILNDGALFTTLFTGGMMIAFILVCIYFSKSAEGDHNGV